MFVEPLNFELIHSTDLECGSESRSGGWAPGVCCGARLRHTTHGLNSVPRLFSPCHVK
jgi:hypothetical protein